MKSFILATFLVTSSIAPLGFANSKTFVLIGSTDSLEDVISKCRDLFRLNARLGKELAQKATTPQIKRLGRLMIADNKVTLEILNHFAESKELEMNAVVSLSRLKNPALREYYRNINSLSDSPSEKFETKALHLIYRDLTALTNELRIAGDQARGTKTEEALSKITGIFSQHSQLAALLIKEAGESL